MGTKNLTVVYMDGDYRVAQYCSWDGYPDGAGVILLKFLREKFVECQFREQLNELKFCTEDEIESLNQIYKNERYPELSTSTGVEILEHIQNGEIATKRLENQIYFAADSLFCEWCYVVDLDKRTFEVYKGFNTTPLTENDRFYFLKEMESNHVYEASKYDENGVSVKYGKQYHGVKMVKSWDLSNLPTEKEFLDAFRKDDDDAD